MSFFFSPLTHPQDALLLESTRQELLAWHPEDIGTPALLGTHEEEKEKKVIEEKEGKKEKKPELPRVVIADSEESEDQEEKPKNAEKLKEKALSLEEKEEKEEKNEKKEKTAEKKVEEKTAPSFPFTTPQGPGAFPEVQPAEGERPIELLSAMVCYICKAEVQSSSVPSRFLFFSYPPGSSSSSFLRSNVRRLW